MSVATELRRLRGCVGGPGAKCGGPATLAPQESLGTAPPPHVPGLGGNFWNTQSVFSLPDRQTMPAGTAASTPPADVDGAGAQGVLSFPTSGKSSGSWNLGLQSSKLLQDKSDGPPALAAKVSRDLVVPGSCRGCLLRDLPGVLSAWGQRHFRASHSLVRCAT